MRKQPQVMDRHQLVLLVMSLLPTMAGLLLARYILANSLSAGTMVLTLLLIGIGSSLVTRLSESMGDSQIFSYFVKMPGNPRLHFILSGTAMVLSALAAVGAPDAVSAVLMSALASALLILSAFYERHTKKSEQYRTLGDQEFDSE